MKEKSEFLDQEKQNNEEVTKKVSMAERQAAKMRLDYQDAETARMQFKDEVCLEGGRRMKTALMACTHVLV